VNAFSFYIGATVLLPKGYEEHPGAHYPVIYSQGHFGLGAPFGFTEEETAGGRGARGYEFYKAWDSENFPRMIAVTFQRMTPECREELTLDPYAFYPLGIGRNRPWRNDLSKFQLHIITCRRVEIDLLDLAGCRASA
jgi:hypothetical protein